MSYSRNRLTVKNEFKAIRLEILLHGYITLNWIDFIYRLISPIFEENVQKYRTINPENRGKSVFQLNLFGNFLPLLSKKRPPKQIRYNWKGQDVLNSGLNVNVTQTLKNTKVRPLFLLFLFFLKEGSCTLLKRVNPFHLLCFKSKWQQDGAPLSKISNGCADVDYRPLLGTYFSLVLLFAGVFMRVLVAWDVTYSPTAKARSSLCFNLLLSTPGYKSRATAFWTSKRCERRAWLMPKYKLVW